MPGRWVGKAIARLGFARVFDNPSGEIRRADLAFGNLECPLSDAPFTVDKRIRLRAEPARARDLAGAGFDVLSVANNHALDAGSRGLFDTLSVLRRSRIEAVGTGRLLVVSRKGIRLGFLGYCDFPGEPGIAYSVDLERVAQEIREARSRVDVLVVAWHWGRELSPIEDERQHSLASVAAKAGADLILGQHPHVWQPVAWLPAAGGRRCLVAYSLGNYLFDSRTPEEKRRATLHVRITSAGVWSYKIQNGLEIKRMGVASGSRQLPFVLSQARLVTHARA